MNQDLNRWNRAGLARVQYVDANAATLLECLRADLAHGFPEWSAIAADLTRDTDPVARNQRVATQYGQQRDDMLWEITRSFARASHVLAATLDAYANEGWLGTASQWENVRRLVAMLDYAPHPASSAYTPLALRLKSGRRGKVAPGLQVRHAPADGGKPVLFETLAELDGDAALNELRAAGYDRNPSQLTGALLRLEGRLDKIRVGDPVVLEDDRAGGRVSAHLVQAVTPGETETAVTIAPPITHAAPFTVGHLKVHAVPKDRLAVKGPVAAGAEVGRALETAGSTGDLAAGDIVVAGRAGAKPAYRRLRRVDPHRLIFHEPLGAVDLERATVARPVAVPISRREAGRDTDSTHAQLRMLRVAGDWSRLIGQWLADIRVIGGREYLPMYECTRAEYTPVRDGTDDREGYTILALAWDPDTDEADAGPDDGQLRLGNPQSLLAPPPGAGSVRPDPFVQEAGAGRLAEPLVAELPKHTQAGDYAVLVRGARLAWARLRSVAADSEANEARLASEAGFVARAGAPFFLGSSVLRGHFSVTARLAGWQHNATPVTGHVLALHEMPAGLRKGLAVIASNSRRAVSTIIDALETAADPPTITLRAPLPRASTASDLVLYGNVVLAGHGETRPARVLGSGDATRSRQQFVLDAIDASFVADSGMPAGVRADVQVQVGEERYTQVGNLRDSGPAVAHYQVRSREDGRLVLEFGDGANGRRLPTGANNVRVTWRQGVGAAGNLPAGSLEELVRPHPLVAGVVQPLAAAGGAEREAVEAMRENAAGALLTLSRAVSLRDFALLARSHPAVAQARAFAPPSGLAQRNRVELVVIPAGGAALTEELRGELQLFLAGHAAPGVVVEVAEYDRLLVGLSVMIRVRIEAFDGDRVAERVRAALAAGFGIEQRPLGAPLYRGAVFAAVDAVEGVENSSCEIAIDAAAAARARRVARDGDGVVQAVFARPAQCVHLQVRNPSIVVTVQPFAL